MQRQPEPERCDVSIQTEKENNEPLDLEIQSKQANNQQILNQNLEEIILNSHQKKHLDAPQPRPAEKELYESSEKPSKTSKLDTNQISYNKSAFFPGGSGNSASAKTPSPRINNQKQAEECKEEFEILRCKGHAFN